MDAGIEKGVLFSRDDLASVEKVLGRPVSDGYSEFARTYGNAFVGGLIDGNVKLPILAFLNADQIVSKLNYLSYLVEQSLLPFARDELGNLWILDIYHAVHYINYYGGETISEYVDESFTRFLCRIAVET